MKQPENMRRNKALYIDYDALITNYNDVPVLRALTQQQYTALVAVCEYFAWRTRWKNPPDNETLDLFAGEIRWRLMQDIEICALFIGCITDDDDVRNALNNWFVDQITNGDSIVNQSMNQWIYEQSQNLPGIVPPTAARQKNMLQNLVDCNLPSLWGATSVFINWLDLNNIDFLEQIEVVTNPVENLTNVLTAFAGIDPTVFGSALASWVDFLQNSLKENYDASWTTAYENEIACDLFCLAQLNGCELSVEIVFLYFMERLGSPTLPESFLAGVVFWTTGVWTGTSICDVAMAVQLAAFYFGNGFMELAGISQVSGALQLGLDQPNDDYLTLCEACPTFWTSDMVMTGSDDYGWYSYGSFAAGQAGHHVPGIGLVSDYGSTLTASYQMVQMAVNVTNCTVTGMKVWYELVNGSNSGLPRVLGTDIAEIASSAAIPPDGAGEFEGDGLAINSTLIYVRVQSGSWGTPFSNPGGSVIVTRIQISGTGDKPPELP